MSNDRLAQLAALHTRREPIVMLTAYDFPSARIAVAGGVDVILVGDSAAMTVLGYQSTREISTDELLMLTRAVRRTAPDTPVIGDLPFGSYEASDSVAVASASRFVQEAGCDAVKLEGAGEMISRVRAIIAAGIPVFGHVGLLPQSVRTREGYKARGRDPEQALAIVADADALANAGCSAMIVEAVPSPVTALITARIGIPVIGIGAGVETGGQVLVYHDLLGFSEGRMPRFVRTYASAFGDLSAAVRIWAEDVRGGRYPSVAETYPITDEALAEVRRRLSAQ
ncbi:MAG: 3-methyl-2-oxobutanoate hydroxymethyltransferase [Gemmatimonadetes bacterium]|nr:3-methyl-2-oxobutanoate hydroxymethyltransferase [Gemmatimonadota bacterium]